MATVKSKSATTKSNTASKPVKAGVKKTVPVKPNVHLLDELQKHFGFSQFKDPQQAIIETLLSGKDTFVIMPTGGGKSLCYQIPALCLDGLTVVISPLIALMKDQVDQLTAAGIPATFLNSTLDPMEQRERLDGLRNGLYRLLYAAPERILTAAFMAELPAITEWLSEAASSTQPVVQQTIMPRFVRR